MSETHCPKCGKEVGSICIVADCPIWAPIPSADPARVERLRAMLDQQAASNDPTSTKLDAALRAQRDRIDALEAEREQMAHQWNAVQDLALLPALPPGWVAVPEEPTLEMLDAGWSAANRLGPNDLGIITDTTCGEIYRAMLAARPTPPAEGGE